MEKIENIDFNELRDRVYKNSCKHGWHLKEHVKPHYIMLIITELSEAVNADRKGKYAQRLMFEKNIDTPQIDPDGHWKFCFESFIKDTVEDELADAVIRILDFISVYKNEACDFTKVDMKYILSASQHNVDKYDLPELIYTVVVAFDRGKSIRLILNCIFSIAKRYNIDLLWHIEQKMKYNEMRPYKHGKKY